MCIVTIGDLIALMLSNAFDDCVSCESFVHEFAQHRHGDRYYSGVARFLVHLQISCLLPFPGHDEMLCYRDMEQGKR